MSTGDMKNNLKKLKAELRGVKFEDVDLDGLSKGIANAFLPIYHHVFISYSKPLAELIASLDIELYGKTDLRFIEAMYKVLRELFSYKPPVTKDQFFANGYGERKVIMCTEVVQMVRQRHRQLAPKPAKRVPNSAVPSVATRLGPRPPASAPEPQNKSKDSSTVAPPVSDIGQDLNPCRKKSTQTAPLTVPRVVNEIIRSQETSPATSPDVSMAIGKQAILQHQVMPSSKVETPVPHIAMATSEPTIDERYIAMDNGAWDYDASAAEPCSVPMVTANVVSHRRRQNVPEDTVGLASSTAVSMETSNQVVRHQQGAAPFSGQGVEYDPAVYSEASKSIQELSSRVAGMERRLSAMESLLSMHQVTINQQQQDQQQQQQLTQAQAAMVTPQQLETILACLTLVESKLELVNVNKQPRPAVSGVTRHLSLQSPPHMSSLEPEVTQHRDQYRGLCQGQMSPTCLNDDCELIDSIPSSPASLSSISSSSSPHGVPRPNTGPLQDNAVEMNTPPSKRTNTSVTMDTFVNSATKRQAERIKYLLSNTEHLMNLEIDTPVRNPASNQ